MNLDDEIERRLLRNARELRGVPIEPPPSPAGPGGRRRGGMRTLMTATCAVLLAIGGGVVIWDSIGPSAAPAEVLDDVAVETSIERSAATGSLPETRGRATRQLLDGYDEVAMIGRVADRSLTEQRPLPPGVV